MSSKMEKFSVLMSVYHSDNPHYLDVALHSIYDDQLVKPDQIIIVADGELLQTQNDIIGKFISHCPNGIAELLQLPYNVGLAAALNTGLEHCRNNLVARMDSDDISSPDRFQKQITFMSTHTEIDVCGSYIDEIDPVTETFISTRKVPLTHNEIIVFARKRSPFSHPSVVFRKNKVISVGGYPPFRKSQDFALWSKMIVNDAKFANISDVLLRMRTGNDMMARRGISHLKYEIKVLGYQRKIGFITTGQFIHVLAIRTFFRILPGNFKKVVYKIIRKCYG
ncbi:acetylgalactosaminyl-diphospho-UDP glucuronosyltransferase [Enterobacterales bacterium CwR94]|nr:acetylgalactosaminyl-diphospho-UDP glucuronosyltransferase [Enterobacterales bacterium CwR94]